MGFYKLFMKPGFSRTSFWKNFKIYIINEYCLKIGMYLFACSANADKLVETRPKSKLHLKYHKQFTEQSCCNVLVFYPRCAYRFERCRQRKYKIKELRARKYSLLLKCPISDSPIADSKYCIRSLLGSPIPYMS